MELFVTGLKLHYHNIGNEQITKYIICFDDMIHNKYELHLCKDDNICYKFIKVKYHGAKTHFPSSTSIDIYFETNNDKYSCKWFSFDRKSFTVNMDLFKPTLRGFKKMPIWIFMGKSNLGKSFLAHRLDSMTIFETDSYNDLPEKIEADIVVLGNKHGYTLDSVKEKIGSSCEIVVVNFSV